MAFSSFNYTPEDLDGIFVEFAPFKCADGLSSMTLADFGLTKKQLKETSTIFKHRWSDAVLPNVFTEMYDPIAGITGITATDPFATDFRIPKEQVARSLLYIAAKFLSTKVHNETLMEWMWQFEIDCLGIQACTEDSFDPDYDGSDISRNRRAQRSPRGIPMSGNLIEFVCKFDMEDLLCRGF